MKNQLNSTQLFKNHQMFTRPLLGGLRIIGRPSASRSISQIMSNSTTTQPTIIQSKISGPIESSIIEKLTDKFHPSYLKIANDSHKHSHHAGMVGASNVKESHFRIEIISDEFSGLNMPSRHRLIYQLLDDELKNKGVHALQMKTKTSSEVKN